MCAGGGDVNTAVARTHTPMDTVASCIYVYVYLNVGVYVYTYVHVCIYVGTYRYMTIDRRKVKLINIH